MEASPTPKEVFLYYRELYSTWETLALGGKALDARPLLECCQNRYDPVTLDRLKALTVHSPRTCF